MADVIEVNTETGEAVERDFTPEEAAHLASVEVARIAAQALEAQRLADLTTARDEALSLGFSEASVRVMWPMLYPTE